MKLTTDEAMKNPVLRRAIEAAKHAPPREMAKSMLQGVNPALPLPKAQGRKRHTPGHMNKTEAAFARHLEAEKQAGRVLEYYFEPFRLRLAAATFYSPDFLVLTPAHFLEVIEVKGHWEDDARVKIKVAAKLFWWMTFKAVRPKHRKQGGGWSIEEIRSE